MLPEDIFNPNPEGTDAPREGYYVWRRTGRPDQPVRIWFGPPIEPDGVHTLERGWRWQMLVSGRRVPIYREEREDPWDPVWTDVWPQCSGHPETLAEYRYLVARIDHARLNDPNDPFAQPGRKIDLATATLPF